MRFALFYHSLVSDWNHGNAHFLRGVASELLARGHDVRIFDPQDSWSRENLLSEYGPAALTAFQRAFPHLTSTQYNVEQLALGFANREKPASLDEWLDEVDLVIVHEWNDPKLISAIGEYRRRNRAVRILFHDTHHRALTARQELARFDLSGYDGVLAYGASLKDIYQRHSWGKRVHVWHEAADTRTFYPRQSEQARGEIVWIGNWGDDERTAELREYFIHPVARAKWNAQVYGVRYPASALRELNDAGIVFRGWLPNFAVPEVFAEFKATVHIPRRPYTRELPGIPTIRPFEALACGIPLVSAPWQDTEGLFRVGQDFLMAHNGQEMEKHLHNIFNDASLARSLCASGLETIRNRHTCAYRVDQLLEIYDTLRPVALHEQVTVMPEVRA